MRNWARLESARLVVTKGAAQSGWGGCSVDAPGHHIQSHVATTVSPANLTLQLPGPDHRPVKVALAHSRGDANGAPMAKVSPSRFLKRAYTHRSETILEPD